MRPQVVCNRGKKPWRLIACRLDDPTVAPRKGPLHAGIPGVLIAGERRLLQAKVVAYGFHSHQRQPAGKRFILGERDGFGWHRVSQTRTLLVAVKHDGLFHVLVDLLLSPVGGADKPIAPRYLQ